MTENKLQFVEGIVAFSNLLEHDVYKGKSTGNYTLTIAVDQADATELEKQGVKLRDYKGTPQRKFKSQFPVAFYEANGERIAEADRYEIPFGSRVRVLYKAGDSHPEFGVPVYLSAVKVLEKAEVEAPEDF